MCAIGVREVEAGRPFFGAETEGNQTSLDSTVTSR
jgi:hypothetical protein